MEILNRCEWILPFIECKPKKIVIAAN